MRALALLSGAALSAALLTACDGGATEPPFLPETTPTATRETTFTPTPEPTPTPTALPTPTTVPAPTTTPGAPGPASESGGMDGFRAFASLIDQALADGDASFFALRGLEDELACTGDEQLGPCAMQPPGTVLRGIPSGISQSDAFALLSPDDYTQTLLDWFAAASPDGPAALHALAHSPFSPFGEEAYQAIVIGVFLVGPPDSTILLRQGRVLDFRFLDSSWKLTGDLFTSVPESTEPYRTGDCDECFDHWERWEAAP